MSGDHNEGKPAKRFPSCRVALSVLGVFGCAFLLGMPHKGLRGVSWSRASPALSPEVADCTFAKDGDCDLNERQVIMNKVLAHVMQQSGVFNRPENYTQMYQEGAPFPHLYFDNMFPDTVLHQIALPDGGGEFPEKWAAKLVGSIESENLSEREICDRAGKGMAGGSGSGWRCIMKEGTGFLKFTNAAEPTMGIHLQGLIAALKSTAWINFLEKLSGISPLYADPTNFGSGLHQITRGGSLQVHADFRQHPDTHLERRVNMFIYFNDDWEDHYGGHLELWNKEMTKCERRIAPEFGRLVIFSTHDFSYHGHPDPLNCPPDRTRRSIAMYYYSPAERPPSQIDTEQEASHSTLYQTRECPTCTDTTCQNFPPLQVVLGKTADEMVTS